MIRLDTASRTKNPASCSQAFELIIFHRHCHLLLTGSGPMSSSGTAQYTDGLVRAPMSASIDMTNSLSAAIWQVPCGAQYTKPSSSPATRPNRWPYSDGFHQQQSPRHQKMAEHINYGQQPNCSAVFTARSVIWAKAAGYLQCRCRSPPSIQKQSVLHKQLSINLSGKTFCKQILITMNGQDSKNPWDHVWPQMPHLRGNICPTSVTRQGNLPLHPRLEQTPGRPPPRHHPLPRHHHLPGPGNSSLHPR
jgi:hypothetical protein